MFKKILYHFLCIIPILVCLFGFSLKGFCADIATLNSFLKAASFIGSEYLLARNGQSLNNATSETINDGQLGNISVKPNYNDVIVDALGGLGPNLNDLASIATDFDVSSMSAAELGRFNALLLGDDHLSGENIFYKTCTVNGMTAYWAVNQAGQWIGNSINNIAVRFTPNTSTLSSGINNALNANYRYNNLVFSGSSTFSLSNTSIDVNAPLRYSVNLNDKIYLYTDASTHAVMGVIPSSFNQNLGVGFVRNSSGTVWNGNVRINTDNNRNRFVIDNITYYYGSIYVSSSPTFTIYSDGLFSSLETIKTQIQANGYLGEVVYSDLIDLNTNLGYKLTDVLDNVVPISDIYSALQQLKEALNGFRVDAQGLTDGLTLGLDGTLLASIQQAIADAIARGLAITDNPSLPIPDIFQGITLPDNFDNNIVTNVSNILGLPFHFISIFTPIFMLFGANIPLLGLWLFFPVVLILAVIIWVLK